MSKTNEIQFIPQDGIFWLYRHEIIFAHKVPLSCGLKYGDAITGTKDHADYWEELREIGKLTQLPTELQDEYFSIPRGRVVYHSDTDRFFIYHGNNVTKNDLAKICRDFNLPKAKTICEKDLHYCDLNNDEWKTEFEV